MPDPVVKINFFANDQQAAEAFSRMEKRVEALEAKLQNAFKKQVFGDSLASGLDRALQITTAIFDQMRQVHEMQAKAAQTNISYAGALEQAQLNSLGQRTAKQVDDNTKAIATRTGARPEDIAKELASAYSAGGGADAAEKAVEAAAKLVPNLPSARVPLAGAAIDIAKYNPGIDAKQSLGFLLQFGQASRTISTEKLAENALPKALQVAEGGDTSLRTAASLVAALSQGMVDVQGRKSGTAAIQLQRQLKEAFPELGSFDERLALVQSNAEAREAFLKGGKYKGRQVGRDGVGLEIMGDDGKLIYSARDSKASFESGAKDAIESLLSGKGKVQGFYQDALKTIPELANAAPLFDSAIKDRQGIGAFRVSAAGRTVGALGEALDLANTTDATAGAIRDKLEKDLLATGLSWLSTKSELFQFDVSQGFGNSPEAAAAARLENRRSQLEAAPAPTPEMQKQIELLGTAVDELRKLNLQAENNRHINPNPN